MLLRTLEPEVMDSAEEASDYDAMDHGTVNRVFVEDLLASVARCPLLDADPRFLDVGAGTAQIPIELCRRYPRAEVVALDLAEHMLRVGRDNVRRAGLEGRIRLERQDAKALTHGDRSFPAVISNSIIHHIPEPDHALAEMVRVAQPGGLLFVRDLIRPADEATVERLVAQYAPGANAHQAAMFAASFRAALTLAEVRERVAHLGFDPNTVSATSDRHWTWSALRV